MQLASARATVKEIEGQYELAKTYPDWTVIRSPINGVVLEKLVDPDELVFPQSFGATRGPSTALISVADPKDLQAEIELNESDVAKAFLGQKCRVSPEAYPDRVYEGCMAEMAPEANRQKVTYRVELKNSLMARRTAVTDYSCICTNNPSNRNFAAKRKSDLAAWFYPRVFSRRIARRGSRGADGRRFGILPGFAGVGGAVQRIRNWGLRQAMLCLNRYIIQLRRRPGLIGLKIWLHWRLRPGK